MRVKKCDFFMLQEILKKSLCADSHVIFFASWSGRTKSGFSVSKVLSTLTTKEFWFIIFITLQSTTYYFGAVVSPNGILKYIFAINLAFTNRHEADFSYG